MGSQQHSAHGQAMWDSRRQPVFGQIFSSQGQGGYNKVSAVNHIDPVKLFLYFNNTVLRICVMN